MKFQFTSKVQVAEGMNYERRGCRFPPCKKDFCHPHFVKLINIQSSKVHYYSLWKETYFQSPFIRLHQPKPNMCGSAGAGAFPHLFALMAKCLCPSNFLGGEDFLKKFLTENSP